VADRTVIGWWALAVAVAGSLLLTPLAPTAAEHLRVSVCRSTGGSCGYVPPRTRCAVLSRDFGVASAVVALRETSTRDGTVVTTAALDGTASVTLVDPSGVDLSALAAERLGARAAGPTTGGLAAVYRFSRHDDADAWLDHHRGLDVPISSAAAGLDGWQGAGSDDDLHAGLRSALQLLGFADPAADRTPDGVVVGVPLQAQGSRAYGQASSSSAGTSAPEVGLRATLDADGRSTTTGGLAAASNQDELARSLAQQVGLAGAATYRVTADATGQPVRLELSGAAATSPGGGYAATELLPRLREGGSSLAAGAGEVREAVVLDLRSAANRAAFERVFVTAGPVSSPNLAAQEAAVATLVARISDDAVFVRTRVERADVGDETRTTYLQGFSEDLAVPASSLTRMPGCSR
jgi:hypothetical protein